MKPRELKEVCDIISIVANAIATNTIAEAEDYMLERFDDPNDPIFQHAFNVMDTINKQQSEREDVVLLHTEIYYG